MNNPDILSNLDNPKELEKLYRDNKGAFKKEFNTLYPRIKDNKLAEYWHERLNYENPDISWGSKNEITFVIIASLLAGLIAKIPVILKLREELFFQRNIGFVVFPILTAYFIWKNKIAKKKTVLAGVVMLAALVFINLLPAGTSSDTLILSCIHLPFLLWAILGFAYAGDEYGNLPKRIDFLRYNGDLVIMTTLLGIAGAILTGITIGLFSVIGFHIERFYFDYIGIFGLSALPVVATYVTQTNPQLVNKVSPVIAKLFSPLVLIMLVAYLSAILYSGKDPYNDREFLMVFNFLLIGVMAIILFSIAESFKKNESRAGSILLLALSVVTIVVNGIALSAILFRISEQGITPNRLAVLGGNLFMLVNLLMISFRLFRHVYKKEDIRAVERAISWFLPVYIIWTVIVAFLFPFLFHFK